MKDLYFSHDRNAMNDNKIDDLRGLYGMEGYGVYWAVVEALSREPDLSLEFSERKAAGLSASIHPSFSMMTFLSDCVSIGLFASDGNRFWSESLRRRIKSASEISKSRKEAASARWGRRKQDAMQEQSACNANARENESENETETTTTDAYDPEWKRVVDSYHREIGALPMGTAAETLISYFEDLGADAMIVAIERTNQAQPDVPYKFLKAILDSFADKGVHDRETAEACCNDFDRRRQNRRGGSQPQQRQEPPTNPTGDGEAVRWLG